MGVVAGGGAAASEAEAGFWSSFALGTMVAVVAFSAEVLCEDVAVDDDRRVVRAPCRARSRHTTAYTTASDDDDDEALAGLITNAPFKR